MITAVFNYICDVQELELSLAGLSAYNGNIVNLYSKVQETGLSGMDYINSQLDSVLESYDGRDAAVNSFLMIIKFCADKGVKLRYAHPYSNWGSVPYNTNEQLVNGMDCCEIVSWAVNKGTPVSFHWEGVGVFSQLEYSIDISVAQPGVYYLLRVIHMWWWLFLMILKQVQLQL